MNYTLMRRTIVIFALAVAAVAGMTLLSGILQGAVSNRWGTQVDLVKAGKRLDRLDQDLGKWQLRSEQPIDKTALRILECKGHVHRVYHDPATGDVVVMAVLLGPKGPIAVHTPEVCYSSRDYTIVKERERIELPADVGGGSFWKTVFRSNEFSEQKLHVYYAWSDGGPWQAAVAPRFWFSDHLYKVQLAVLTQDQNQDPGQDFLKEMAPALAPHLIGNEGN